MLNLYHGTCYLFDSIVLTNSKNFNDFGNGFYTSIEFDHAKKIAIKNAKRLAFLNSTKLNNNTSQKQYIPYIYTLNFDDTSAFQDKKLHIKLFDKPDNNWLKFIFQNRFNLIQNNYDLVIGPTTDAKTMRILSDQKDTILKENFSGDATKEIISKLKPEVYPKQYCFKSYNALKYLKISKQERINL